MKVQAIEWFTLKDYDKLKNVHKVAERPENEFNVGDTFECDEEMYRYLTEKNKFSRIFVKILEEPKTEKVTDEMIEKYSKFVEEKPKKKNKKGGK